MRLTGILWVVKLATLKLPGISVEMAMSGHKNTDTTLNSG